MADKVTNAGRAITVAGRTLHVKALGWVAAKRHATELVTLAKRIQEVNPEIDLTRLDQAELGDLVGATLTSLPVVLSQSIETAEAIIAGSLREELDFDALDVADILVLLDEVLVENAGTIEAFFRLVGRIQRLLKRGNEQNGPASNPKPRSSLSSSPPASAMVR